MVSKAFGSSIGRYNLSDLHALAEAGHYYKVCNPTPGTGIAMGIQTSFSATANVLMVAVNTSATKLVIPHYLRLINTAVGATTASSHLAIVTDVINRYSATGDDLTASIKNARSDDSDASALTVLRFGIVGAAAASAPRTLARMVLKTQATPCFALGDEFKINFLAGQAESKGLLSGTVATEYAKNAGPIVLAGANHSLLFHMWNPSNATTAPSWEMEFAWFETPKAS